MYSEEKKKLKNRVLESNTKLRGFLLNVEIFIHLVK